MRLLALLACSASALAGPAVAPIDVELVGCAGTCSEPVRLGDVAYLRTPDLAAIRALVALPLREAGPEGSTRIARRELAGRIAGAAGIDPGRIVWSGHESVALHGTARTLGGRDVEGAAGLALRSWLDSRGTHAGVAAEPLDDPRLPPGGIELKSRITAARAAPRMVVWVDAWLDGAVVRSVPVAFSVDVYREALPPVPAPAVGRSRPPRPVLTATPSAPPWPPGPPEVRRGEWVEVRYATGSLQLAARAEALEQGRAGERVRVRLPGAAQPVEARVVARGEVEALP